MAFHEQEIADIEEEQQQPVADYTVIEDDDEDDDHSSQSSTDEFNFASALALRKNLTETFDKHVTSTDSNNNNDCLVDSRGTIDTAVVINNNANDKHNGKKNKNSVSSKIAFLESKTSSTFQKSTTRTSNQQEAQQQSQSIGTKPPRHHQHSSLSNNMHQNDDNHTNGAGFEDECLSVYLRIRPTSNSEKNDTSTMEVIGDSSPSSSANKQTTVRTFPPADSNAFKNVRENDGSVKGIKEYQFEQVFGPQTSQQDLYSNVAAPLVRGLFPSSTKGGSFVGHSALLFAYGITNAGKTYTIMGKGSSGGEKKKHKVTDNVDSSTAHWGIVPRALQDIFTQISQLNNSKKEKYSLRLSYLEIYNEQIYDLLDNDSNTGSTRNSKMTTARHPLKIREGHNGESFVKGLSKHEVKDVAHGLELAKQAKSRRHTSSNNLNADSSRSHCVVQLQLVAKNKNKHKVVLLPDDDSVGSSSQLNGSLASGYTTDEEASQIARQKDKTATLWIVDLAGSERLKRTNLSSVRQKEASLINSSLMKLMRCLSVMRESRTNDNSSNPHQVVPFRESKLTHLFMNHLTGPSASRTGMIVNVNPSPDDFDETQHVLAYAVAAKSIQLSKDEYQQKQKFAATQAQAPTHGYDGRPIIHSNNGNSKSSRGKTSITKNKRSSSRSKAGSISRLAKKFSPKKMLSKKKPDKRKAAANDSSSSSIISSSSSRSVISTGQRATKMPRLDSSSASSDQTAKMSTRSSSCNNNYASGTRAQSCTGIVANGQEIKSLKTSLMIANAETEVLRSEKNKLEEELSQVEEQVRMEVAEEAQEQMEQMREHYNHTIDRLKGRLQQFNPTPVGRSAKKARTDKAEKAIEELMDKVDECEEEMVRMRELHTEELEKLQEEFQQRQDIEIQKTKQTQNDLIEEYKETIERLQDELKQSRGEVKRLRQENKSLDEKFRKVTKVKQTGGQPERDEENVAPPMNFSTIKSSSISPFRKQTGSMKKNKPDRSQGEGEGGGSARSVRPRRAPFSSVSMNQKQKGTLTSYPDADDDLSEIDSDEESELLYPKQPPTCDQDGMYTRPKGRAPNSRMWDSTIGAWRLSVS